MRKPEPSVIVVDDDASFRQSTARLIRTEGFKVETFPSAEAFLTSTLPSGPACLILDVRMPGLSGIDVQRELGKSERQLPIIFITGHGDVPMSVRAMKHGAIEFLTKPFDDAALLKAVHEAIDRDIAARKQHTRLASLRANYALLTAREREVMAHVVSGSLNKQIAGELGTKEKTVKFHRAHVMQKMNAKSVAELVRMAATIGVGSNGPWHGLSSLPMERRVQPPA